MQPTAISTPTCPNLNFLQANLHLTIPATAVSPLFRQANPQAVCTL